MKTALRCCGSAALLTTVALGAPAGAPGIIAQQRASVAAGATRKVTLKVAPFHLDALKSGKRITVSLQARATDGALAHARRSIKVR